MRVLFINQFFHPDIAATAQLLTDLAEDFVLAGCRVTVVTGRTGYGDGHDLGPARERYKGIEVYRVGGMALRRHGVSSRYLSYLGFWITASLRCLTLPRHDVVVPLTTPPLLSCLAAILKAVKGSRVVCWSMDVYPDLGVLLGAVREDALFRVLDRLASWSLRRADAVVALGPHMAERLAAKGVVPEKVHQLTVWEHADAPVGTDCSADFRAANGLDGRFVVLYSGNMGAAHEFDAMLDAADALREDPGILFACIGGGPKRAAVEERCRERGLNNVRFLPYQPREVLQQSLRAGDVHLVTLRAGFEGLLVPSKFVGALRAGRPLLFVGPNSGEIPDVIRAGQCGIVIESGDGKGLAKAIVKLKEDGVLREQMGANARRVFEQKYTRERVTAKWIALLRQVDRCAR